MKKITGVFLAVILLFSAFPVTVLAYQLPYTDVVVNTNVHTEGFNNHPEAQAQALYQLGLFLGTDKGFELDRPMTRAEAAVMLVRFLGAEEKVRAGVWKHPFKDVPVWADKYIGWLWESGLTKGVSATQYAPQRAITLKQYAQFLSRALMGPDVAADSWIYVATEQEVDQWDNVNGIFNRDTAVGLSLRAMTLKYIAHGNWMTMAQLMINRGMFTAEEFGSASWNVLPSTYNSVERNGNQYLTRYVAEVPVNQSEIPGLSLAEGSESSSLTVLHATRTMPDGSLEFYELNPQTLMPQAAYGYNSNNRAGSLTYIGSPSDGSDYFVENLTDEKGIRQDYGDILHWNGERLRSVIAGREGYQEAFAVGDSLLIAGKNKLFYVTEKGISNSSYPEGSHIVHFDGMAAISQLVNEDDTIIRCLNTATGAVLDEYIVKRDMEGEMGRRKLTGQQRWGDYFYFYGEAGLYRLTDGRLKQVTDLPALDMVFTRNDSRPVFLTRNLGEYVPGMNGPGGNQIMQVEEDDNITVLVPNDPPHEIWIAGFVRDSGVVLFYSAQSIGMQVFNRYIYTVSYDDGGPYISVIDFESDRPEMEPGWSPEEPMGYRTDYILKERARLKELFGRD